MLVLCIGMSIAACAQEDSLLWKLPKDSLVRRATKIINRSDFKVSEFDQVSVWVINKELVVKFSQFIQFVPLASRDSKSCLYSADVSLSRKSWSSRPLGKGERKKAEFYYPKSKEEKKIGYVMKVLTDSIYTEAELNKLKDLSTIQIWEDKEHYSLRITEEASVYVLKIRKKKPEIFDESETDYIMNPRRVLKNRIY